MHIYIVLIQNFTNKFSSQHYDEIKTIFNVRRHALSKIRIKIQFKKKVYPSQELQIAIILWEKKHTIYYYRHHLQHYSEINI